MVAEAGTRFKRGVGGGSRTWLPPRVTLTRPTIVRVVKWLSAGDGAV